MAEMTIRRCFLYLWAKCEAFIWLAGLLLMALMSPADTHMSFCPLRLSGLGFCPGCGLGHSIAWLARGEIVQSFHAHPLGIFAVVVLAWRIVSVLRKPVAHS